MAGNAKTMALPTGQAGPCALLTTRRTCSSWWSFPSRATPHRTLATTLSWTSCKSWKTCSATTSAWLWTLHCCPSECQSARKKSCSVLSTLWTVLSKCSWNSRPTRTSSSASWTSTLSLSSSSLSTPKSAPPTCCYRSLVSSWNWPRRKKKTSPSLSTHRQSSTSHSPAGTPPPLRSSTRSAHSYSPGTSCCSYCN